MFRHLEMDLYYSNERFNCYTAKGTNAPFARKSKKIYAHFFPPVSTIVIDVDEFTTDAYSLIDNSPLVNPE